MNRPAIARTRHLVSVPHLFAGPRFQTHQVAADFAGALIQYIQDPAMMLFWLSELRE